MRIAAGLFLLACTGQAQFESTVPLVIAPASVTDSKGHYVDGLTAQDLILYDNNVPQKIQMDWMAYPISLVVAVQTNDNSGAVIDKLGRIGILLTDLLAANEGETALISFSDEVRVRQGFTNNPDLVTHSLRMLRKDGGNAHMLDAIGTAVALLEQQPRQRRRIILMIAERRDRSSESKLSDVMERVQRMNATVYWLSWSPMLQPFTVKPKTMEDLKPEAERIKKQYGCVLCPEPDDRPAPPDLGPGNPIYAIGELIRLKEPDLSNLFPSTTGGRSLNFLKKNALEQAIQLVGEEVHREYILSFEPKGGQAGAFHTLRVDVKDRPGLRVRARSGYWVSP
ncbi:MAG TPA: VWA domain-containing protein [Bryobacteraceae bacterium]|nr:VWA domain-containing protein [Bryobacteraceae bacterium]